MSTHEQITDNPTSAVRNTGGRNGPQGPEEPMSDEILREMCDKNYHQLLPFIAEKLKKEKEQKDKLNAVKARLIYGEKSGIKMRSREESHYSESKTPTAQTEPRRRHRDRSWANADMVSLFNTTLTRTPEVWLDKLPKESIDSYEDLRTAFRENYLQQTKHIKDPVEIHHIKQKDGESTEDFMERYKAEVLDVEGESTEKRKRWKRDKPLTILMIQPWERVAKPRITQSFSPETAMSFPPLNEEDGTESPMIIEIEMGGHFVHRVYIDGHLHNKSYIWHTGIRKIRAVPSTAHGMLKFPVEGGTVTLQSSRVIPMECAMISGPSNQTPVVSQIPEVKINVAIHPEYPEQTVAIGSTLTEKGRTELCKRIEGSTERNKAILEEVDKLRVVAWNHKETKDRNQRPNIADFIVERPEDESPDELRQNTKPLPSRGPLFTTARLPPTAGSPDGSRQRLSQPSRAINEEVRKGYTLICKIGLPGRNQSPNGKQSVTFHSKIGVKTLHPPMLWPSVKKHPQANGLVERANRSLGEGIKARLEEKSMPTLGTTKVDQANNNEALGINLDLIEERKEQAAIQEAKSKKKIEKYYNSRVRGTSFKPGEMVYRSNEASHAKDRGKLGPKWEGPYEVKESLGKGAYKLKDRKGNDMPRTWNICNLKKCYIHEM
ncbi:reverse transcriptase domain-containing protein [Tanacetum coccineum]